jgi:8-oxo-dGTP pyrophosphatase MutT (NUDIX family)
MAEDGNDRRSASTPGSGKRAENHGRQLARWAKEGRTGSPPVAAATVILIRDTRDQLETLMLRKNSRIAFGGMWVFPGGRVDEGDHPERMASDAHASGDDAEVEAARRAAVRETEEEAGLEIPPGALVPFSHWTPPPITPKRFLTWFFLAAAPPGNVVIDDGEIHEHEWMAPATALQRRDAGEIELAPPTWVTLHELSMWKRVDEALAVVRKRAAERFETRIAMGDTGPLALWHGDAGWDSSDASAPGSRHRLAMSDDGWRYERTD